jgi:predicted regulator of Ras-like GTPase activity (Roadblock/LC7/MglB family)
MARGAAAVSEQFKQALDGITRVRGVRGALLVTDDDGLVIADAVMEGVRGDAVAALAASLTARMARATVGAGVGEQNFLQLQAEHGTLLTMPAPNGVLVVVLAEKDVNVGLVRLEMLRAVEAVK